MDATHVISRGVDNPTGTDRVEISLLDFAIHSDTIGIAVIDRRLGQIDIASQRTKDYIRLLLTNSKSHLNRPWRERFLDEFKFLDVQYKYAGKSAIKRWLKLWTENLKQKKYLTSILKPIFKSSFILYDFILQFRRIFLVKNEKRNISSNDIILSSYFSYSDPMYIKILRQSEINLAHVIYDLIPILNLELFDNSVNTNIFNLFRSILINEEISIAISETVRDEFSTWNNSVVKAAYETGFHACKLAAPFPSDYQNLAPVSGLFGKRFAMCVSTFEKRKGYALLIKIWAKLAVMLPAEILPDLVLIGRVGNGFPAAEAELQKSPHLAGKVHIFHDMNDHGLAWCYQNAMLGVFASTAEGWGLSVSEFLSHRVPVVHSDIPILHEAAQNLMPSAPVNDTDAWVTLILDLLLNPQKLKDLVELIDQKYEAGGPESFANCVFAYLKLSAISRHAG